MNGQALPQPTHGTDLLELRYRREAGGLGAALAEQLRAAPWYVGSFGAHILAFAILMLLPNPAPAPPKAVVTIEIADMREDPEPLEPPDPEESDVVEMVEFPSDSAELRPVELSDIPLELAAAETVDIAAEPGELDDVVDAFDLPDVMEVRLPPSAAMTARLTGNARIRTDRAKRQRVSRYGGAKSVEPATRAALEFLKAHQPATGLYGGHCERCQDGHGPAPAADPAYHASATALAALAFMGSGSSSAKGRYREQVAKCLKALLAIQRDNGEFFVAERKIDGCPSARNYAHAVVLWAVAEAQWMHPEGKLADAVRRGVAFAVSRQREDGGWQDAHSPNPKTSDSFVTAWYVMALLQARDAGAEIPGAVLRKARDYFTEVAYRAKPTKESRVAQFVSGKPGAYTLRGGDWTIDAAALACMLFLEVPRSSEKVRALAESMAGQLRSGRLSTIEGRSLNFFGQYFASMGLFQYGAGQQAEQYKSAWSAGNQQIVSLVPSTQIRLGTERERKGSWNPAQESAHGPFGARVGLTAAGALILEVFYRYDFVGAR